MSRCLQHVLLQLAAGWSLFAFGQAAIACELEAPETAPQAQVRHQRVAERREGVAVICHRGALEFAHENTLEAFRATLELGADGNEIDIRATSDGVLVCFHDDMLDAILDAYGDVSDHTWQALQAFRFRRPGQFGEHCRIPTLRETLLLHRRHAGLLHLDVKRPGLEGPIVKLLDELDLWDHVIGANENCPTITSDPRFKPLAYKAGLYLDRSEIDQEAIAQKLKLPGKALMVEDPRGVLFGLGRKIGRPSHEPVAPQPRLSEPIPQERSMSNEQLLAVLNDDADWNQAAESESEQAASSRRITARAKAADELARRGNRSRLVLEALTNRVRHRSLHKHWRWHGLDGAAALRALFALQAPEAIELARQSLWRNEPELEAVKNPEFDIPRSWVDWRLKTVALRELQRFPGAAAEQLCRDYLKLDETAARKLGPVQFEAAALALLKISQDQKATSLEFLRDARSEVRGRAVLFCVAHADQPWAREALGAIRPETLAYVPIPRGSER